MALMKRSQSLTKSGWVRGDKFYETAELDPCVEELSALGESGRGLN